MVVSSPPSSMAQVHEGIGPLRGLVFSRACLSDGIVLRRLWLHEGMQLPRGLASAHRRVISRACLRDGRPTGARRGLASTRGWVNSRTCYAHGNPWRWQLRELLSRTFAALAFVMITSEFHTLGFHMILDASHLSLRRIADKFGQWDFNRFFSPRWRLRVCVLGEGRIAI